MQAVVLEMAQDARESLSQATRPIPHSFTGGGSGSTCTCPSGIIFPLDLLGGSDIILAGKRRTRRNSRLEYQT